MAYFDNAATTYPKPERVYEAMDRFYRTHGGSARRGTHAGAQSVAALAAETRGLLRELFHAPTREVIFTATATIALNMIIQGLIKKGLKSVYISPFEHNAVTRVLHAYPELTVTQLAVTPDLRYDMAKIDYQFASRAPELVIVSHASNVIGLVAPVDEIFTRAKKYRAYTVLDMSQTAGLVDISLNSDIYDLAVFAGHKTIYGPTGISGFLLKPGLDLPPVLYGGTGVESASQDMPTDLPARYEMGTLNTSGLAGLNAALKWLMSTGIASIRARETEHRERLLAMLRRYDFIRIVGAVDGLDYVGVVSIVLDGISSDSAAGIFAEQNIALRTGLHCAPLAHKFLGTYPAGTVRLSIGYFTSDEDFNKLERALDYIADNI